MILATLLLTFWLVIDRLCNATSTSNGNNSEDFSRSTERLFEGPNFFLDCPLWEYGYKGFAISPVHPQHNDYYTDFSTATKHTVVNLDHFRDFFPKCDGSLKRNQTLVFPDNEQQKEALQPEIFVRPWIEQVLDKELYVDRTVTNYRFTKLGGLLLNLEFGYLELSRLMADPKANIWKKFEYEADRWLNREWRRKIKQKRLQNRVLETEFKNLKETYDMETKLKDNLENKCNELFENTIPVHRQYYTELWIEKNQLIKDIQDVRTDISDLNVRLIEVGGENIRLSDSLTTVINSTSRTKQEKHDLEDALKVAEESNRKTRAEQISLEKNVETVKAVNEEYQKRLKILRDESHRLQSNLAELGTMNDTLNAGKQKAEENSMKLKDEVNELNDRNNQVRRDIQTAEGVYNELKNGVFTTENMQNVVFNFLTTEYIENKWGIPPFLVNTAILAAIVVLLLILLIIWKSRKPKCTCKNIPPEDIEIPSSDTSDETETPKRPTAGSSVKQSGKHFIVDMDNEEEDEEELLGQMNPNYRHIPVQSHIRPILCRAKPAMFVSED